MPSDHDHAHHDHPHDHDHEHGHDHAHAEGPKSLDDHAPASKPSGSFTAGEAKQAKRLLIVLVTIAIFFVAELAGAIAAKSEVLKVDALHLLMDVFALAMSLLAMRLAVRRPTARFTFGLRRAEPVAALFNAGLVMAATVGIIREGIGGLREGNEAPNAGIMLVVALAALGVNGVSAWLIHGAIHHDHGHGKGHAHGHGHAMNLRGAWLHLLGDTLGSVAAIVAAVIIRAGGPPSVDPIASFLVAAILIVGALRLVRDGTLVLLEAAPPHLPVGAVRNVVSAFPGVLEVHDLHVWTLGAGHDAITVHVRATHDPTIARRISDKVRSSFGVEYVTVQVESPDEACDAPPSRFEPGIE